MTPGDDHRSGRCCPWNSPTTTTRSGRNEGQGLTPPRTALLLALALSASACRSRPDPCGDPVQATRSFVQRMEGGDRAGAFTLLSHAARKRIETAAGDASRTLDRTIAAPDLLVPERSVLPPPDRLRLHSQRGDEAWVEVKSTEGPEAEADVPWTVQRLVREDGCWKIDLFHPIGADLAVPANRAQAAR